MKKNKKNEELQSRREFFRSAAKGALPILTFTVLGSPFLSSCGDGDKKVSGCGSMCSGGCSSSCSGDCDGGCTNNCDGLCGGDCWAYCESKYKS